jgi:hypothetical protein
MIDNEIVQKLAAGAAGAGLGAWMARAAGVDLLVMFMGGFAASYFFVAPITEFFNVTKAEGAVGFSVGFLAILVMRKVYETVQGLDTASLGTAILDKLRKILGVS